MIFPAIITDWDTRFPGKRLGVSVLDYYILNPNRIVDLVGETLGTIDDPTYFSSFLFSNNPNNEREAPDFICAMIRTTEIEQYHNTAYFSKLVTFDIYPHLNLTGTPVATTLEWENIAYFWQTYRDYVDNVCRMVYYRESWQRVECIIDHTLVGVMQIANTGNDLD
jgi:hypothetical protein